MTWFNRAAVAVVLTTALATTSAADQWNDKTTLKFDAPMMIPGATLAPGTYTFKLLDSAVSRHVVQIFNEDGTKLIATTQTIPTKRMDSTGDVVIKVNPTETGAGAPAALKAWFYPGSLYGHEFIYPDREARDIAQRTKTLVLSGDVAGSDMRKGTLHTYDAQGQQTAWKGDDKVLSEWEEWSRKGRAAARVAAPGTAGTRESTAPMMRSEAKGMEVSIGDLEENPAKYTGKVITVTAEVESVFGPRLFKIDEPGWGDLDGEVLVHLPSNLAALVREEDRLTVTGTMKMLIEADLQRELGWLEPDPDVEVEFARRPVLEATQIVGGNSNVALAITVSPAGGNGDKAVGTSGTSASAGSSGAKAEALTDPGALANANSDMVGRQVRLEGVKVSRAATKRGFWIESGTGSVFVLPADDEKQINATAGQSMTVHGVVLEMPRSLRKKTQASKSGNEDVYIYATTVK